MQILANLHKQQSRGTGISPDRAGCQSIVLDRRADGLRHNLRSTIARGGIDISTEISDTDATEMGKPAARMGDNVLQDGPHCHAPIHPAAPVPTPVAHPPLPLAIVKGQPNVLIGGQPAARMTDITAPCMLPTCVPAGPGMIQLASTTVLIGMLPAARMGDMTMHASCVAPIPMPTGKILPPCCPTVMIGG